MIIRKAKFNDAPAVLALWKEFMRYHDDVLIKKNPSLREFLEKKENAPEIFLKYIKKCIRSKNNLVLIAEEDNKTVGYSLSYIKKEIPIFKIEKSGYFSDLFIKKEYRGKGISSRFKEEAVSWFRKKGIKYMSISVYSENDFAHSIYKKWGFFDFHIEMRRKI